MAATVLLIALALASVVTATRDNGLLFGGVFQISDPYCDYWYGHTLYSSMHPSTIIPTHASTRLLALYSCCVNI
jgi:hypothetical protein